MNLSKLDKRVTIQKPVKTSDSMGGYTVTWTDVKTVWAAVWPVSVRQHMRNEHLISEISHRIRIRYRRGVRPEYRVKYKDRYYAIVGEPVNVEEKDEWIDLMCKGAL